MRVMIHKSGGKTQCGFRSGEKVVAWRGETPTWLPSAVFVAEVEAIDEMQHGWFVDLSLQSRFILDELQHATINDLTLETFIGPTPTSSDCWQVHPDTDGMRQAIRLFLHTARQRDAVQAQASSFADLHTRTLVGLLESSLSDKIKTEVAKQLEKPRS